MELNRQEIESGACTFCGKRHDEVERMVAGPKACICDECIELCVENVHQSRTESVWRTPGAVFVVPRGSDTTLLRDVAFDSALRASAGALQRLRYECEADSGAMYRAGVRHSALVVADLIGLEPGVVFGLGLANAFDKPVMLFATEEEAMYAHGSRPAGPCPAHGDTACEDVRALVVRRRTAPSLPGQGVACLEQSVMTEVGFHLDALLDGGAGDRDRIFQMLGGLELGCRERVFGLLRDYGFLEDGLEEQLRAAFEDWMMEQPSWSR